MYIRKTTNVHKGKTYTSYLNLCGPFEHEDQPPNLGERNRSHPGIMLDMAEQGSAQRALINHRICVAHQVHMGIELR